jgi:hypothetical protein
VPAPAWKEWSRDGEVMESTLAAFAFAAFIVAQFAAVVAVQAHAHSGLRGAHLPVATHFDDLPEKWRSAMFAERKPRGTLTVAVAGFLLLTVGGFVWSKSSSNVPDVVTEAHAATAPAISPMDLTLQHQAQLPTERWEPF